MFELEDVVTADAGAPGQDSSAGGAAGQAGSSGQAGQAGIAGAGGKDAAAHGPSCEGLASTCGPGGDGDCCTTLPIPGGTFARSYDAVGYADAGASAKLSGFHLDAYEVTVGRFRSFVAHWPSSKPAPAAGSHPKLAGSGWNSSWDAQLPVSAEALGAALACEPGLSTWTDEQGANESRPINCVTWFEAFAFCAWDGGRLPTEAEWNFAASGGGDQRSYPWSQPAVSQDIDPAHASYYVDDSQMCFGDGVPGCGLGDLLMAGSKAAGVGKWGQFELAGNVMEWVLDWHAPAYPSPCNDCANLVTADNRVTRGGSFDLGKEYLLSSYRFAAPPASRYRYYGVRCARD